MSPRVALDMDLFKLESRSERDRCGPARQDQRTAMRGLSWVRPDMVQRAFSSIALNCEATKANEVPTHMKLMELFPENSAASNPSADRDLFFPVPIDNATSIADPTPSSIADSRIVSTSDQDRESGAQLTIFYNGAVNVFDVSPAKAEAIMKLARITSSSSSSETITPTIARTAEISKACEGQAQHVQNRNEALPMARKLSIKRFLQKRKDRISSMVPYSSTLTLMPSIKEDPEDEGRSTSTFHWPFHHTDNDNDDKNIMKLFLLVVVGTNLSTFLDLAGIPSLKKRTENQHVYLQGDVMGRSILSPTTHGALTRSVDCDAVCRFHCLGRLGWVFDLIGVSA